MDFSAAWSGSLIVVSVLTSAVLFGAARLAWTRKKLHPWMRVSASALPCVIVIGCAFSIVRGYTVLSDTLLIKQLFATTSIELSKLTAAEHNPSATVDSVRTWGNGGLFSFSGRYSSPMLGEFRAFVTDWENSVVLVMDDAIIVVSPSHPEEFVAHLQVWLP